MWLPEDERRLLAGYYASIGKPEPDATGVVRIKETPGIFHVNDLSKLLRPEGCWPWFRSWFPKLAPCYGQHVVDHNRVVSRSDDNPTFRNKAEMKSTIERIAEGQIRVHTANSMLEERELIRHEQHSDEHGNVVIIHFNIQGYDLGRRYSNLWERSGLWFQEYRHHWFWLIVAFVGGGATNQFMAWLYRNG